MSETASDPSQTPTRALDVDVSDLLAGIAYSSGGRDNQKRAILTIPAGNSLDESGITSLVSILKYYIHVAQEDPSFAGICVLTDLTDAGIESRVCILLALQHLQRWYKRAVSKDLVFVFTVSPELSGSKTGPIQKLLTSCVGTHTLLRGYKELSQYAAQDQRTSDLKGTLLFDLDRWLQWRFSVEPFMGDCASCKRHTLARLDELKAQEQPETGQHQLYIQEIMTLRLDTLINEGTMLGDRLASRPDDPLRFAMACSQQCRVTEQKVKQLNTDLRNCRLEIALACNVGEDGKSIKTEVDPSEPLAVEVKEVSDWICQSGLENSTKLCQQTWHTKEECDAAAKQFDDFRKESADPYIARAMSVTKEVSSKEAEYQATLVQESKQLHSLVVIFQSSLAEHRERLDHAMEWHSLSQQIVSWASSCLEMLASCSLSSQGMVAGDILQYIDDWLAEKPPPDAELRQRFSALSFALRRHAFFSTETETVRSALSQAETQLKNVQEGISEQVRLQSLASRSQSRRSEDARASPEKEHGSGARTSAAPSETTCTRDCVSTSSSSCASSECARSTTPVDRPPHSAAVQEKLEEFFSVSLPAETIQQLASTDDESYRSDSPSSWTTGSSPNESDGEQQDGRSSGMIPITIEPNFDEATLGTLGRIPKVSLAHIAAAPCPPGSGLRSHNSSELTPIGGSESEASGDEADVCVADGDEDCDPHARRRRLLMNELVTTEEKYIGDLDLCIREYVLFAENDENKPRMLVGKKNIIFGNIESLYDFNRSALLPALQALQDDPLQLGSVFAEHEAGFGMYSMYFKNMPQQEELAEDCNQYFRSIQIRANDPFTLNSYLIKPFQRMTRYRQFLEGILKHVVAGETVETEARCEELRTALWIVSFHLRHGNDLLVLDRLKGFDGNPAEQGMLLRQDDFVICINKQFRTRKRRVFLFEEMVVVAKLHPSKSKKQSEDTYYFKDGYRLTDVTLAASAVENKFELCIKKRMRITFQAEKEAVKKEWVADIHRLLWHQAMRLKERMAHVSSGIETRIFDRTSYRHNSMRSSRGLSGRDVISPSISRTSFQSLGPAGGSLTLGSASRSLSASVISGPVLLSESPSLDLSQITAEEQRYSVVSAATLTAEDEAAVPDSQPRLTKDKSTYRETSL